MDYSTVSIKKHTKQRLDHLGNKNDSYDDVISRLLDWRDKNREVRPR
ncbi:MAG: DUF7557 family protein [Nitrososphaera sp.]